MSAPPVKVALLDDYVGVAPPYFSHLEGIQLDSFAETIVPGSGEEREALIERLSPYEVILSMRERTPFPREVLCSLPRLKLLLTTGPYNRGIDLGAARERGIVVAGTSGRRGVRHPLVPAGADFGSAEFPGTNQQTFALLLSLANRIAADDARLGAGGGGAGEPWQQRLGFVLGNKTIGLLGLGRLGAAAARTAVAGFGMRAVAWSANLTQDKADEAARRVGLRAGDVRCLGSKDELLRVADVVSVHYVLSQRSVGLLGRRELQLMKPSAVLVNTSRGPLVDEQALLEVLNAGTIRGAALDVFDLEPLPAHSPWRTTRWGRDGRAEVVISPHMGYGYEETMQLFYAEQADSLDRYLRGESPLPDLLYEK